MKPFLRFPDLVDLGLVNNWTTLNNWINKRGFPPGHLVGRMWTAKEVLAWIESQPTKNSEPLRGIAKKARAESDARGGGVACLIAAPRSALDKALRNEGASWKDR